MKKQVVIVIPIHQDEPSKFEKVSLAQTLSVLGKHPITFQTKEGVNTQWYEDFCRGKATVTFERFKWNGAQEYNNLLALPEFYQRFKEYEYMLICHLDAFVFRDELEKWCEYGYDYIPSIIYNTEWDGLPTRYGKLMGLVRPEYFGNGGFGLRKIETFVRLVSSFYIKSRIFIWKLRSRSYQEDILLCQIFPKLGPAFKMPGKSQVQLFGAAFEIWDEKNLPFGNSDLKHLPFGIHGWYNYHLDFWKPCIRAYGHTI